MRRVGSLRVAVTDEEAERVRGQVEALRQDGFPGELVEHDALPPVLRRRGLCACLVDHDAALHPARWYRALAEAAERAGVRICEGTAVQAPVSAPGEGEVQTDGGSVRARHVIVAADGALPVLVPEYAGRVRPAGFIWWPRSRRSRGRAAGHPRWAMSTSSSAPTAGSCSAASPTWTATPPTPTAKRAAR